MPKKKQRECYFIKCPYGKIEVEEPVYRAWVYWYNRELTSRKQFYNRTRTAKDGSKVYLPSQCISLDDPACSTKGLTSQSLAETYEVHEAQRVLNAALAQLDKVHRYVICELFFAGKTQQQIADTLGLCQTTISNYKRDALRLLRGLLLQSEYTASELLDMLST